MVGRLIARLQSGPRLRSLAASYGVQALNVALPLVALPFVARAVGPDGFGRYGLLLAVAAFAAMFIDFGLGVPATRAAVDADPASAERLRGRVLACQLINASLVLPVTALALLAAVQPAPGALPVAFTLAVALATGLAPTWFHVARASVGQLLVPTLWTKLVSAALSVLVLPVLPSLALALFAYALSWAWSATDVWRARTAIAVALRDTPLRHWRDALRDAWTIPLQRLGSALYLQLPAMLAIGLLGPREAGFFVLADRLVRAASSLMQPVIAHLMPMRMQARHGDAALRGRVVRLERLVLAGAAAGACALFAAAGPLVRLVGGPAYDAAADALRWLAPLLLLIGANGLLLNRLYAQERAAVVAWATWCCGLAFAVLLPWLGAGSLAAFCALGTAVEAVILAWLAIALSVGPARSGATPTDAGSGGEASHRRDPDAAGHP